MIRGFRASGAAIAAPSAAAKCVRLELGGRDSFSGPGGLTYVDQVTIGITDVATEELSSPVPGRHPQDRQIVHRPVQDPDNQGEALVTTILRLAEELHPSTTAEGIEHQAQHDTLQRLNCNSAQGYLMSRPLSARAALDYIIDAAGSRNLRPADRPL